MSVRNEVNFAIVPEWVLLADVSAHAVRVYAALNRRASRTTARTHPKRKTIAAEARCSVATVDRAIKELTTLGAIEVRQRKAEDGDWTSNEYVVRQTPPNLMVGVLTGDETPPQAEGTPRQSEATPPHPRGDGALTGEETVSSPVTNKQEPAEPEPVEPDPSEPSAPRAARVPRPADPVWDTLVELFGDPPATKRFRGGWNATWQEIRSNAAVATPDHMRAAHAAWEPYWSTGGRRSGLTLTVEAFGKFYTRLVAFAQRGRRASGPGMASVELAQALRAQGAPDREPEPRELPPEAVGQ